MADEKKVTGKELVEIEYIKSPAVEKIGVVEGAREFVHENVAEKLIASKYAKKVTTKEK